MTTTWFPTFRRLLNHQRRVRSFGAPFTTRTQSEALLRIIALAVEQRLPLAPLLQAFAKDQSGVQRRRVQRLAELLEEGCSLPQALEQVSRVLPEDDVLAIRFGSQSGTLSLSLRSLIEDKAHSDSARIDGQLRSALVYPVVVLVVILMIATFLLTKIWPTYQHVLYDFEVTPLPMSSQWVIYGGTLFVYYWWILLGAVFVLTWTFWTERPGRSLRRRLVRPWFDMRSADVLQCLSVVTKAGRPIPGAISTLARYHHDPTLRQKLLFVRNEVEQGADLWDTLQKVKLLTPTEGELMEAAQNVGNRPWAMGQLATCKRRRMCGRLELLRQLVEPAVVVLLGVVVLTICLGGFVPLIKLIMNSA